MSSTDFPAFNAPPINEVGFSFTTVGSFIDPYDVRGAHGPFKTAYPNVERKPPVVMLDASQILSIPATMQEEDHGAPPRWWFISDSRRELVQVQERFVGWNWRRHEVANDDVTYPGFDVVSTRSTLVFEALKAWRRENYGDCPPPSGCQLMYDNFIRLRTNDGQTRRLGEVLKNWNSLEGARPVFGWQMQWLEQIGGDVPSLGAVPDLSGGAVLTVQISMVGVIVDGVPIPVLRIMFQANKAVSDWDDGLGFFSEAHDYIRETFMRLTTDEIQASWGKR